METHVKDDYRHNTKYKHAWYTIPRHYHTDICYSTSVYVDVFHRQHETTLLINNEIMMRKFYASANAICSHVKYASEITVLFLFCLLYTSDAADE